MYLVLPTEKFFGTNPRGVFSVLGSGRFDVPAQWALMHSLLHIRYNGSDRTCIRDDNLLEGLLDEGSVRPLFARVGADFHNVYAALRRGKSDAIKELSPAPIYCTPMFATAIKTASDNAMRSDPEKFIMGTYDLLIGVMNEHLASYQLLVREADVNVDALREEVLAEIEARRTPALVKA